MDDNVHVYLAHLFYFKNFDVRRPPKKCSAMSVALRLDIHPQESWSVWIISSLLND